MLERKTVSQCPSSDYCMGWNDAVKAMSKWISVEERLPEESGRYLVYTYDDRIIDAYYSEESGKLRSYSVVVADKRFTHWMPIDVSAEIRRAGDEEKGPDHQTGKSAVPDQTAGRYDMPRR